MITNRKKEVKGKNGTTKENNYKQEDVKLLP
eukprot:CAMPEP_0170559622 /NCGR_PEP_ID=MMETSP0211-20121228/44006_1 /TAXON_ID=311385 /ORGANISM="Pseudokeronopsis sp., Strain OXSARD2" /LENGTH=30 /DNA_ID= /DNA_START= /DNA_END= /DNA_ORIENTATION=